MAGKRGVLISVVLAVGMGIGIGAVWGMNWWNEDIKEADIKTQAQFSVWVQIPWGDPHDPHMSWDRFEVDRGRRTFRGTLRIARMPLRFGRVDVEGPAGDYVAEVTGQFDTISTDVPNALGLPLKRPTVRGALAQLPADPMLIAGEPSEQCWRETQTINQMFDAFIKIDHYKDDRRIYGVFAARFFRLAGNAKAAEHGISCAENRVTADAKLPVAWVARLNEEKRLFKSTFGREPRF